MARLRVELYPKAGMKHGPVGVFKFVQENKDALDNFCDFRNFVALGF